MPPVRIGDQGGVSRSNVHTLILSPVHTLDLLKILEDPFQVTEISNLTSKVRSLSFVGGVHPLHL